MIPAVIKPAEVHVGLLAESINNACIRQKNINYESLWNGEVKCP